MPKTNFSLIAKDLKNMFDEDQKIRLAELKEKRIRTGFQQVDLKHQKKLRKIISEIGWPTYSKVGKEASGWAWMIAQHSDNDLEFQKECLKMMSSLSDTEVNPINKAYLEDRVRLNEERPLLYGTQIPNKQGDPIDYPIEDKKNLNQRRADLGLEPYEKYRENFLEYLRSIFKS